MLDLTKRGVRRAFPGLYAWIFWRYAPYPRLARKVTRASGMVVASGPFEGTRYPNVGFANRLIPKLLGSYEEELHGVFRKIVTIPFRRVYNVGAAEGYYAVGLARAMPEAKVLAFETDEGLQERCRQLASFNGVAERVEVRGTCTLNIIRDLDFSRSLVIIDCEGAEDDLLGPAVVEPLRSAYLVVETHDFASPGITARLAARFSGSHSCQVIGQSHRDPRKYPQVSELRPSDQEAVLDEQRVLGGLRANQSWLFLTPKEPPPWERPREPG